MSKKPFLFVLVAAALAASGCAGADDASTVGGDGVDDDTEADTTADEAPLLAGRHLSESETAGLLRNAGFPSTVVRKMVCTAKYESSFYERASNRNSNGTTDRGLFQINSIHVGGTPGCPKTTTALYDAQANTRCALAIYRMQGLGAWYGYKKHRAECDRY